MFRFLPTRFFGSFSSKCMHIFQEKCLNLLIHCNLTVMNATHFIRVPFRLLCWLYPQFHLKENERIHFTVWLLYSGKQFISIIIHLFFPLSFSVQCDTVRKGKSKRAGQQTSSSQILSASILNLTIHAFLMYIFYYFSDLIFI